MFHFHSPSGHTIDSKSFDFELDITHTLIARKAGYDGASIGLLFDVKNYDKTITAGQVAVID